MSNLKSNHKTLSGWKKTCGNLQLFGSKILALHFQWQIANNNLSIHKLKPHKTLMYASQEPNLELIFDLFSAF